MEQRVPFVRALKLGALLLNLLVLAALNALIRTQQQEAHHTVLERTNVS